MSSSKIKAIIVDIDGTLAVRRTDNERSPYDWSRVSEDLVVEPIATITRTMYQAGYTVIIVSGRDEVCRLDTESWLEQHDIPYNRLYMRPRKNNERDSIVKERIYRTYIHEYMDVLFVIDDRDQVVKMWRSIGLTVLQCAEGNF